MARLPRVGPKELVLSQAARADLVDIARYNSLVHSLSEFGLSVTIAAHQRLH